MEDATSILDLIREALLRRPDDIFITNTYMGFIATLVQLIGSPDSPLDIPTVLKELKIVLSHPKGDKLQIAHTGVQIWFKFFEDPSLQQKLMIEEREAESQQLNPSQAYLRGLLHGAFRPIVLEPFFLQAMCDVLLPFPQLERILGPFRSAILSHLNVDSPTDFESLVGFIHALSLQLFRCNYLWDIKEEDQEGISMVKKLIEKQLKDVDQAAPEGILPRKLYQQLSIYSMFHSLNTIANMEELALKLDLTKLPATFVNLLNKSIFAESEERDIKDSIIALTAIPDTDLVQYFNQHVSPTWDSPPLSVLTPVTVEAELKLRYPKYTPNFKEDKVKVLIAACGSGREIYQVFTTYKNVEITAIDISEVNLAYAIRQNTELGVTGVKYYLADVLSLSPSHFPSQFDVVIANDFLHYCPDPIKAWDKLSALVRPGGLFMATLHNKKLVNAITKMRSMLTSAFKPALFDNSPSPKLLRIATDEEVREARRLVLDSLDQTREVPAELMDLVTSLAFYSLNEFRDLVFHPVVTGFTYTTVNKLINQLGLKLVGFDFPEMYCEKELSYKGEYYTDRAMAHGPSLDAFDAKDSSAFAGFYISFTCEKPL
jgi:SAM-dependent methyltransferase